MTLKEQLIFDHLLPHMDIRDAGDLADRMLAAMNETPMIRFRIEQGCCYAFVAWQPGLCHEHEEHTP